MKISLIRADIGDAKEIWQMQTEAFAKHLENYRDYDTNPGNEPVEKVAARIAQEWTYFYYILADGVKVGAVRVVDFKDERPKRISPLFIMPQYRDLGYGQAAIKKVEDIHGSENWALETILQESGNLHFYEKLGYRLTGEETVINERMTIVGYEK